MRHGVALWLLVLFGSFAATAQVLPTSGGGCGVGPSGVMDCAGGTSVPLRRADADRSNEAAPDGRPELVVIRFTLSPGAPLSWDEGRDVLIIGMGAGELVNEMKSPSTHISVWNGSAMLMLKEEHFLLRNVGKQDVELLVVVIRR